MTASFADNEIWHVLIATDDMKRMNVEQLDDAFRLSLVDASTLVWKTGMKTWQRLGAVAGIDDEPPPNPFTSSSYAPPPPPAPRPAPRQRTQVQAAYHAPMAQAQAYATPLVAPVFTPAPRTATHAPDPYMLPKRRVAIPSEVDFRRNPRGVHWGRWLLALLLLTGGVLGAYRQNVLREGARRIGFERQYLYGEQKATAFVSARASSQVKSVLTRLKLLPGPNASPPLPAVRHAPAPVLAPPPAAAAPLAATTSSANEELEVKTVSLDSLPVLAGAAEAAKPSPAATAAPQAVAPKALATRATAQPVAKPERAAVRAEPAAHARAPKPALVTKAERRASEPKRKAEPPPPANESFLNSAIRSAIASDKKK